MEPLIQLTDVRKSFGGQEVLKGVNLSVYEGKTTVIIGETVKGKGVPFMEGRFQFHNAPISQDQWAEALRPILAPLRLNRASAPR